MTDSLPTENGLATDENLQVFRRQLKAALEAGGVFFVDEIAANIEGLIVAHIMRLVTDGAKLVITQEQPRG